MLHGYIRNKSAVTEVTTSVFISFVCFVYVCVLCVCVCFMFVCVCVWCVCVHACMAVTFGFSSFSWGMKEGVDFFRPAK